MPKCPKCGHDVPRDNGRIGGSVVEGFLAKINGSGALADSLAEWFRNTKQDRHRAGPMFRTLLEMIQNEDKARVHQNFVEDVSEIHERGLVMEYVLADRDLLEAINAKAVVRGLLPAPNVVEAEYERVS